MQPFLDKLAKHLYIAHGSDFSRICIVFPSRRAGLFFKQHLSRIIDKPIWLPDIYALEDFVVHKSGLTLRDPLELIARLYKVYKSIEKEKAQPFSEFISWGNMLLGDFDEIDQYLADGEKVFQYLDEIKALKHWNPDGKPLTPFEQNYLRFYNSLAPCYKIFRDELLKNKEGYFGLAFEILLQNIQDKSFDEWKSIVFAGFNALTAAETRLLKYLVDVRKAELFWDADEYYISDPRQEAGRFLRDYINNNTFGELKWIGNSLSTGEKEITVIGVPGNVGQAKLAGELIQNLIAEKGTSDGVALVLVDEGLLLPVLNSIPANTGDFNVTMGFPLKQTPVFSMISVIFDLFANAQRYACPLPGAQPGDAVIPRFYHKDIQRFLSHPFIVSAMKHNDIGGKSGSTAVTQSFYNPGDLYRLFNGLNDSLAKVFKPYLESIKVETAAVISLVQDIISYLRDVFAADENQEIDQKKQVHPIELEYLFHAAVLCAKLDEILKDPELKPNIETVQSIVGNLIAGMRIPFYGEPLNGLQIMGMLETRILDFTDLIMISVNEGILPRGKHHTTFIPDEVRTHFGMQRYSERTAIFAYHFYRLLQQVDRAWLIYSTEGDELGGGEKSRFISQLIYEMPKVNPRLNVKEQTLSVTPVNINPGEISVKKSPEITARLRQLADRGLSPTALAMYMKCTLQFYFSQVLRISEPDQISETIDAATLGEIVHHALQKAYASKKHLLITPEVLSEMLPFAVQQVHDAFAAKVSADEIASGKNLLIVKVAENMVKRLLIAEKKYLEQTNSRIEIIMIEEELHSFMEVADSLSGEVFSVKLHGKADRIDRVGGITRIIDYKTGKVESKDLKLDLLSDFQEKEEPGKLLQVLAYALMYSEMQATPPDQLISGIISLRKSSEYLIRSYIQGNDRIDKELLRAFKNELGAIVGDIFNSAEPFRQTENFETCSLCAFNTICNRTVN